MKKESAFSLLRKLYNEDYMWVELTPKERGKMDKRIHDILCREKINHQCEKGQHFKRKQ